MISHPPSLLLLLLGIILSLQPVARRAQLPHDLRELRVRARRVDDERRLGGRRAKRARAAGELRKKGGEGGKGSGERAVSAAYVASTSVCMSNACLRQNASALPARSRLCPPKHVASLSAHVCARRAPAWRTRRATRASRTAGTASCRCRWGSRAAHSPPVLRLVSVAEPAWRGVRACCARAVSLGPAGAGNTRNPPEPRPPLHQQKSSILLPTDSNDAAISARQGLERAAHLF